MNHLVIHNSTYVMTATLYYPRLQKPKNMNWLLIRIVKMYNTETHIVFNVPCDPFILFYHSTFGDEPVDHVMATDKSVYNFAIKKNVNRYYRTPPKKVIPRYQ